MEAMDAVKLDIYKLKHSLDDKLVLLTLIRNKINTYRPEIANDLNETMDEFQESLRNIFDFINTQFLNNFFPFIELINPLVMNPSENGIYEFVSGCSPWKFLLKNNAEDEFKNIKSIISQELSTNGLSNCKSAPECGDVVLVSDNGNIYRGFVLEIVTKMCYRIMDIDTGEISSVAIGSLNILPSSLAVFPPQVIYCTLLKDSFYEKYWNDSFSKTFIAIMKKMKFSIKIIEQISINPPCYEVHLTGFKNGDEIDFSDRFFKIFFQNIELYGSDFELFDKYVSDSFEAKYDSDEEFIDSPKLTKIKESDGNNDDLAAHFDDNSYENDIMFIRTAFENFSKRLQEEENISKSQIETTINLSAEQEIDGDSDDDYENNIAFLTAVFNENCKDLMETSGFQQFSSDVGDEDLSDLGDENNIMLLEPGDCDKSKGEVKIYRSQVKDLLVLLSPDLQEDENLPNLGEQCERNITLSDTDIVKERKDEEKPCRLQSYPAIEDKDPHLEDFIDEEFEDEKKICRFYIREPNSQESLEEVEENMPDLGDEYESNIAFLEADIGEDCKDEVKTCKFQLKKGHCWKEYCPREHINPGPGYIGSIYTYTYFDVEYPLPEEKETIYVKPKVIVSGHVFYGHLINYIIWNQPDLKLLETRMNSKEELIRFEHFDLLPAIGELCLAYGKSKRWYRARIIEVDEIEVQVLNVDYGYGEKVSFNNIRKIKYEYLFLPPQAIRFELQGIIPIEDKKSEAMKYMRDVALNQVFKATVKESYQQDSCIEISLICPSGQLIEASLITKGYYRTLKSYSNITESGQLITLCK